MASNIIHVWHALLDTSYQIECTENMTYKHVKDTLLSMDTPMTGFTLVNANHARLSDDQMVEFPEDGSDVVLKLLGTSVSLFHLNQSLKVTVSSVCTIAEFKRLILEEAGHGGNLEHISIRGQEARDEDRMDKFFESDYYSIKRDSSLSTEGSSLNDKNVINGHFLITIKDKDCFTQHDLEVLDYYTVSQVIGLYEAKSTRKLIRPSMDGMKAGAQLRNYEDEAYSPFQTLYDAKVTNNQEYFIHNPPFLVHVIDKEEFLGREAKENVYDVEVHDAMTVRDVRVILNSNGDFRTKLEPEDGFVFNNLAVAEEENIYKLRITQDSHIYITREAQQMPHVIYICGKCGKDVKLKKGDSVQCRECAGCILYKVRTKATQQFTCR